MAPAVHVHVDVHVDVDVHLNVDVNVDVDVIVDVNGSSLLVAARLIDVNPCPIRDCGMV